MVNGRQRLLWAQENRNARRREQELRDMEVNRYYGEQRCVALPLTAAPSCEGVPHTRP